MAKDNFDVAGLPTSNGHPTYGQWHGISPDSATSISQLTAAGAALVGRARMHELAYGLTGVNPHFGTPVNPRMPGAIPGGSSSGSAAAVADGLVDFALGTDTGGSVRVPAGFCGIYGYRPTFGLIPVDGTVPLGKSFDTVGVLARTMRLVEQVARVLLDAQQLSSGKLVAVHVMTSTSSTLSSDLGKGIDQLVTRLERTGVRITDWNEAGVLDAARVAQSVLQGAEAYQFHRRWLETCSPELGGDVRRLLEAGSGRTSQELKVAKKERRRIGQSLRELLLPGGLLIVPTALEPPPTIEALADDASATRFRHDTLNMTNLASLVGLPVVSMPIAEPDEPPLGVQVIGTPCSDVTLLTLCREVAGMASCSTPAPSPA